MLERVERNLAAYGPDIETRLRTLEESIALIRGDEMRKKEARRQVWATLRMFGAAAAGAAASHYWPPPTHSP